MRQSIGLDLPEWRISLSAHDFAQALGAKEVFLTRPAKLGGAPTVASRFLQRLAAVAGEKSWIEARKRGELYLGWARALDRPEKVQRIGRPEPRPRERQVRVGDVAHEPARRLGPMFRI